MKKTVSLLLIICCVCLLVTGSAFADQKETVEEQPAGEHHIITYRNSPAEYNHAALFSVIIRGESLTPRAEICCDAVKKVRITAEDHYYIVPLPSWCSVDVYHCTYCENCGAILSYVRTNSYTHYHQ